MNGSVNTKTMNTQPVSDEKLRRLQQLIDAATKVFLERGYRRAGMADIAREMAVAPGTLYLYVSSKEALFDLVLRWHLGPAGREGDLQLPIRNEGPEKTFAALEHHLRLEALTPGLLQALAGGDPADPVAELSGVLNELYDMLARYRTVISLLQRSSLDWPEMDGLYSKLRRNLRNHLSSYIRKRSSTGAFAAVGNSHAVARFIMEYVGSFSMQRVEDLQLAVEDEGGRQVCINMLLRALLP